MDQSEWWVEFQNLCGAFSKEPVAETSGTWFENFGWMERWQWKVVAAEIQRNLERFPAPAQIYKIISDHRFYRKNNSGADPELIAVECPARGLRTDFEGRHIHLWTCSSKVCGLATYAPEKPTRCERCKGSSFTDGGVDTVTCDGSFAGTRKEFERAAQVGQSFPCINRRYGCPMVFNAARILELQKEGVVRRTAWGVQTEPTACEKYDLPF